MDKNTKNVVESITNMDVDFSQWYTDVVKKAELVDYSSIRGCMILRPYGYAIWELIQKNLDEMFKKTGHENIYMPLFIPESLLQKEKDHIEGFAPEVAWVTHGGDEKLAERLCVRPTSETLFCEHYSNIIQSYRDLPKLYNQWCNVVRWEKTTRPFLRTMEFLWQEGHTAHASYEEAQEETIKMLNIYSDLFENLLSIPVVKGKKTEKEKFAGAESTYTIESLMHDGKALQSGTSHNFGDGFAKTFDITYTDENNKLQYVNQTSWGVTTRIIGAIIMVHGDNNGLVLPPKIAPIQVIIVPIAQNKEGVIDKATSILNEVSNYARAKLDLSNKSPGWKFSEYEMKGVPIRLEIGPKDIQKNQAVLVRRDNGEKIFICLDNIQEEIVNLLENIQKSLFTKAQKHLTKKTYIAKNMEEFKSIINNNPGFIKAMWCGDKNCEDEIKECTGATSRCIPFVQEIVSETCVYCNKKADQMLYFAKSY